tara:strand:- start:656 stop:1432 length:777 start_codon:yes stop_codon:yes gene_type:complete
MEDSSKKSKIIKNAPAFLQEILPYISPRIFDLVDIPKVALNMGKLSYQYIFSTGITTIKDDLLSDLPRGLYFENPNGAQDSLTDLNVGEKILELFFTQILVGNSFFLDLRSSRFEQISDKLIWSPNGLHCKFSENFQHGLKNLYTGFFHDNDDLYKKGLEQIGLISSGDTEEMKQEIMDIFANHFGDSNQEKVVFRMSHFTDSFHSVFDRIFEHKKKLNEDFVYLGIYLVTLYLHLEEIDEPMDVRKIFNIAFKRFEK